MRKFAALFLTVLLTLSLPALAEEGDWSLEEILINADPAVVNQTVTGNGTEEEDAAAAEEEHLRERWLGAHHHHRHRRLYHRR